MSFERYPPVQEQVRCCPHAVLQQLSAPQHVSHAERHGDSAAVKLRLVTVLHRPSVHDRPESACVLQVMSPMNVCVLPRAARSTLTAQ
jgi:hypothetical protein